MALLCGVYPLLGFGLVGEGVVRIGLLIVSKTHGEQEWMNVSASTYREHIVLCGLGHLGFRILTQLLAAKMPIVALEKEPSARHRNTLARSLMRRGVHHQTNSEWKRAEQHYDEAALLLAAAPEAEHQFLYAEARAKLLKQAGVKEKAANPKVVKAAKRTPSQEEPQRRAA